MINTQIGITQPTAAGPARLKATGVLTAALIQIGRTLAEGDDGARLLIDALEDLGQLATSNRRDGELDAALDDVAELAHLDDAVMDLTAADVRQLFEQAARAVAIAGGSVIPVPEQRDRRAS